MLLISAQSYEDSKTLFNAGNILENVFGKTRLCKELDYHPKSLEEYLNERNRPKARAKRPIQEKIEK